MPSTCAVVVLCAPKTRLMAQQTWPVLNIAPWKSWGATSAGLTSGSTTAASLPPSSSVTFLRPCIAAVAMIFWPVRAEPVKVM